MTNGKKAKSQSTSVPYPADIGATTISSSVYTTFSNPTVSGGSAITGTTPIPAYQIPPSGVAQSSGLLGYPPGAQQQERFIDFHARQGIEAIKQTLGQYEVKLGEIEETCELLNARLEGVTGTTSEGVSQTLSNALRGIDAIRSAYLLPSVDGYDVILVYPDSMSLVDFLERVVPSEIEIDRKYKNTYFDFQHLPESEFSIRSFPNAKPISLN